MAVQLTWLGHGAWQLHTGQHSVLIDPFLDHSPTAPVKAADVDCDFILVSHGHADHVEDVPAIANRTGATVVGVFEITQWLSKKHHVKNTVGMNIGGQTTLPFGRVKLTLALHSSQLPDGTCGGNPVGFLLTVDGMKLYFACDTGLFGDMQWIGQGGLDVAVLPIGDHFTMGPEDSLQAIQWLQPRLVFPSHYNTWDLIAQGGDDWARSVREQTSAMPIVLQPGGTHTIDSNALASGGPHRT